MTHPSIADLEAGFDTIRAAPRDTGVVELIVRRPAEGQREIPAAGQLDPERGLLGDAWTPSDRHGADDQLTLMSSRVVDLLTGDRERWPHKGCSKFAERFGHDGLRFVNTPEGRSLRLRGVYARVVTAGVVRPGDAIRRMP